MIFDWYKIFNIDVFDALDLYSEEFQVILQGYAFKTIMVYKGIGYSVLIDGVFLRVDLNAKNPFIFEERAIFVDENDDVFYGVLTE